MTTLLGTLFLLALLILAVSVVVIVFELLYWAVNWTVDTFFGIWRK